MTTQPDDHTLNACLARVIGKVVTLCWNEETKKNEIPYYAAATRKWDPLHDANQMELVEAWLRENGYEFGSAWSQGDGYYTAHVLLDPNPTKDPKILYRTAMDPDKKRAFALAVWELERGAHENST